MSGHRRIEAFRCGDEGWGYRVSEKKRGRWRALVESEAGPFRTYAECIAAAELSLGWIALALMKPPGPAVAYHLELLRGVNWQRAEYREEIHGEHNHCVSCHVTLMERDRPDAEHAGYVTQYEIPFDAGQWQWNWACKKCFVALQAELEWKVED